MIRSTEPGRGVLLPILLPNTERPLDSHQLRVFWPASQVPCIGQVVAHLGVFSHFVVLVCGTWITSRGMVAMMKSTFLPCSPGCISLSSPHSHGLKVCLGFPFVLKRKTYRCVTSSLKLSLWTLAALPASQCSARPRLSLGRRFSQLRWSAGSSPSCRRSPRCTASPCFRPLALS